MKQTNLISSRAVRWGVAALILLTVSVAANAHDFYVGGIYYNILSDTEASVTYGGSYSASALYSGNVVVPQTVTYDGNTYSVTEIGNYAFNGCSGLTGITIPNSVTTIGDWAFYGCSRLTSVTIPNSVTSIGESAFYYCRDLTSVTIGNSVTEIGGHAFYGCSGLTGITIPNSVTTIGFDAFRNCTGLTSVTIPNSVTEIGGWAFENCTGLTSIYSLNPEPPTCHSSGVFNNVDKSGCTLYVPKRSKNAYSTAYEWEDFGNIVGIEEGVLEVDGICYNIISTTEKTCEVTYKDTYYNSYSGNVVIPETVTYNGNTYTVIAIGFKAFHECSDLTGVTIPNSVVEIDDQAFWGCPCLTEITIPEGMTTIGDYAFYDCI